jgi:hypothetical protein
MCIALCADRNLRGKIQVIVRKGMMLSGVDMVAALT